MSFALEYRRKRIVKTAEAVREKPGRKEGFAAPPPCKKADTARNRLRGLAILVIAATVLGLFNSGSLVGRTQSLHETGIGRKIIVVSEKWHHLMEAGHMTAIVDGIRGAVASFREASWQDVAEYFSPASRTAGSGPMRSLASPSESVALPPAQDPVKSLRGSVVPEAEDEDVGVARDAPQKSVQAGRTLGY